MPKAQLSSEIIGETIGDTIEEDYSTTTTDDAIFNILDTQTDKSDEQDKDKFHDSNDSSAQNAE